MTEQLITNKKPVYTISLKGSHWVSDNIEQPGNGRITLGAPKASVEAKAGKNMLYVGVTRCKPGVFGNDYPYEVMEIHDPYLETPDGDQFASSDLIDRIEIEGYRRVWSGAYVAIEDLDDWITAAQAQRDFKVAPATVRQAINREIVDGKEPEWARKSAGTWMVRKAEAEKRWGNK